LTGKEFIGKKVKELSTEGLKSFPEDFIFPCDSTSLNLPGETLIIGNEFFGSYEILTSKGNLFGKPESFIKAKYIVYAGKHRNKIISIPLEEKNIETMVRNYEMYLDTLLRQIENEYAGIFPDGIDLHSITNDIFRKLNLIRL
jgi:hypothetical protein